MKFHTYLLLLSLTIVNLVTYAQDAKNDNIIHTSFKVFGACEQCKTRIELAVKIKGVKLGIWDVDTKMLTLEYDSIQVSLDKIEKRIIAVGHDLVDKKAKDIIYKDLPACCHYREMTDEEMAHDEIEKKFRGVVLQDNNKGKFEPLSNASVYWLGTRDGVVTDSLGVFTIKESKSSNQLVISYIGYKADTMTIEPGGEMKVILASKGQLNEVTVYSRQLGSFIPMASAIRTQVMTGTELLKAACCNLSESFETNPSVDVSYNDAVTGSKQIQLLGLSGNYTQLTIENLPGPRGLATPLGLNSIAGPWIESIQLTKGVGSVANGFESIAGQINVELKKPETAEKLLGNIYVNEIGKTDLNLNLTTKLNTNWATALLLHDNFLNNAVDMNEDGFKDLPTGNELSLVNRYKYDNSKGVLGQFGFKVLNDKKLGGEIGFDPIIDKNTLNHYGLSINTERYEVFGKMGYVFPQQKYKSIGLQVDATSHQQNSYFGFTNYNANQQSFYGNLIYQSIINSTIHKFRTGISFQYDHYNEDFKNINYARKEIVPGAFFEYTYTPNEKWSVVAGIRGDDNNMYGSFLTPRINMRYEPFKGTAIRLSAGRGQRTANIFAENNSVFVSARQVIINPALAGAAYGLQPEIAWNKGISIDQKFNLFKNSATLGLDFFRNDFDNQVIVDLENARSVQFYNLKGKSYSNSFQAELNITPLKKLDVRLAYRYFDVKQTYNGVLLDRPFIAKNRAFLSIDYATETSWKFNYTVTYNGKKRIVNTTANPSIFQLDAYSPSFILMNAQVSKTMGKKHPMDVYLGSENISNIMQKNTILSANNPFSPYFDASMVWGPTTGRMLYMGWRMKIM
jgi:outer membrane receptor for ferrienterochelin and colicin